MKILISAYSCESGRGSEGEIGWQLVHHLSRNHEVQVITRANLRPIHDAAFAIDAKPENLSFVYFDLPWIFRFYKRGQRYFLFYYYLWQIGVGLMARRLVRVEHFDLMHHLIGGMDWMPSGLALAPGQFLWGPVGSENTHSVIRGHLPVKARGQDWVRLVMRWAMRHLDPFTRFTGARAEMVLTHTPETMPRRYASKMKAFNQTGISEIPSLVRLKTVFGRHSPLRLIYAGELKDWKGAKLALDATLRFFEAYGNATLTVIGDGPLCAEMKKAAGAHPEGARVTFRGSLPMATLIDELCDADIFLYPSFHHGLSTVVLQSMLTGLPTICMEGDATGRVIGQRAGITVQLARERNPAHDLADAIARLARDEGLRQRLGRNARLIAAQDFNYKTLAGRIDMIYRGLKG